MSNEVKNSLAELMGTPHITNSPSPDSSKEKERLSPFSEEEGETVLVTMRMPKLYRDSFKNKLKERGIVSFSQGIRELIFQELNEN